MEDTRQLSVFTLVQYHQSSGSASSSVTETRRIVSARDYEFISAFFTSPVVKHKR